LVLELSSLGMKEITTHWPTRPTVNTDGHLQTGKVAFWTADGIYGVSQRYRRHRQRQSGA